MRYQLYIAGMNGKAWVTLTPSLVIPKERFPVIDPDGQEKSIETFAVLRSDGAMQPVVIHGGQPAIQTPEGVCDCVEVINAQHVIQTKALSDRSLQYVRRTGHVGIAPKTAEYVSGEPEVGQWRIHPVELMAPTSMTRASAASRRKPIKLADGTRLVD